MAQPNLSLHSWLL